MLDIAFYTKEGKSKSIDLSSDTYEFLAKAGFGKISKTVTANLTIDEEVLEIDAVDLSTKREEYSSCIRKAIVHICFSIAMELKDVELENFFGCIKKLKELLLQIENENNKFMEF